MLFRCVVFHLPAVAVVLLLAACGGGTGGSGIPAESKAVAGDGRARILSTTSDAPIPADAPTRGMFGPLQNWPLIPLHAVLTPDGRVMSYGTQADGTQTGRFIYDVWDSLGGSHLTLANGTGTDLFCSSQILLPAGDTVLISGGDNWTGNRTTNTGNNNSNTYNVATQTLTRAGNMNRARWYATSTTLLNGETFIQGGTGGEDLPEIRSDAGSFRLMSGVGTAALSPYYPRNFVAPDGRIFGFDGAGLMYYINTTGTGSISMAGQYSAAVAGADSTAAMFAPGRILQFGGNSKSAIVIDINGVAPVVSSTGSLAYQRRLGTATLLPNGQVLASGGSSIYNESTTSNPSSVVAYNVEIWNPQTGVWTVGAPGVKTRLYHSIGMLLPDATVLVAGGGAQGPENNTNGEIYYPPYLFTASATLAARPVIASAPTVVDVGSAVPVSVTSGRPVARVTLVASGAVTHGWNMNQRFVELPFTAQGGTLTVQIPAQASSVPPGMWMMFAIDDLGVPSVAKMVRVNVATAGNPAVTPVITTPGNQTSALGTAVNLAVLASDPNNDVLSYSASGLPPGLAIDRLSGRITGTPTTIGTYSVTLAVSDGVNSASVIISWTVNSGGTDTLVLNPPPAPTPTGVGTSVAFSATASGSGVQFSWNFGDGSPATLPSASGSTSHVFTGAGIYYVTVTATAAGGATQTQTVMHQAFLPATANAPSISSAMALETRSGANTRLWVVNPDSDTVSVFDTVTRARVAEIFVETGPASVAVAPNGTIWVTNKKAASVNVISPTTLAVTKAIGMPSGARPHGIAMARGSSSALIALEATGQLAKVSLSTYAITALMSVGPNPRHVSVASDGSTAYVSRYITKPLPGESTVAPQTTVAGVPVGGEVVVVNSTAMSTLRTLVLAHSNKPDAENQGRGLPNYLGAAAISPDGTQAFVPSKQDNVLRGSQRDGLALNFQNTVRAISSRIDLAAQREDLSARIDHDNASVASAAAFDPLGVYLFVALETSREVAVVDAFHRNQVLRFDAGRAPQALLVSADRRTLYVQNFMDRSVGVYDLSPLTQQARAAVTPVATLGTTTFDQLSGAVLLGKQHFYDARDPRLARDRYMSCATCHNEAGHDGRVWDLRSQGEGLRNTIALRGRAGAQGRLHWSNNFDEVQDFEGQIRTLAGGTGLMTDAQFYTGTVSQPLGDKKAGLSADLDALAAYLGSLSSFDPAPARPGVNQLSAGAADGRNAFIALNCAACHSGAAFTRSGVDNPADVGTIKPSSGLRLNGALTGIDVPTLRDVWATAPYLHDGSAATLEAAISAHTSLGVSPADATRLAAYLREIGADEGPAPVPPVLGTGLSASYFNGTALAGAPLLQRVEAVNFDWGTASPGPGVPATNYSVRWTGTVNVPVAGKIRFRTVSADGVRLTVGGTQRINNWTNHALTTDTSAQFSVAAGSTAITLDYYEAGGSAAIQLQWLLPGATVYATIPSINLNAK